MPKTHRITYVSAADPPVKKAVISSIERLSGRNRLEDIYEEIMTEFENGRSFWDAAVEKLDVQLDYDEGQLTKIPSEGPVIFVANHPYGLMDGLTLCYLAGKVRLNFKILINAALCREERLNQYLLPIDFNETKEALRANIESKRAALATLKAGGAIVIFPAGGISTAVRPFGPAVDLEWKLFMAKLVQMTAATVVPIFFHGQNDRMFQLVSQVSLTLRLSLIIREVNKQIGRTLKISIGDPLPYQELAHIRGREALTLHLRRVTYALGGVPERDAMRHSTLEKPNFSIKLKGKKVGGG